MEDKGEDNDFFEAIDNYKDLLRPETEKLDQETLICECFCVSVRDIQECLHSFDLLSFKLDSVKLDLLTEELNMGKSCGACVKNALNWINKV